MTRIWGVGHNVAGWARMRRDGESQTVYYHLGALEDAERLQGVVRQRTRRCAQSPAGCESMRRR